MLRLLGYSSGYDPCGVADYNRHLASALARLVAYESLTYPTRRVARNRVRSLLALRREYRTLAALSEQHDVVLLHFASKYWNGGRPVENMQPLFLAGIDKPIVMVLHEWPTLVGVERHQGAGPLRLAKSALTAALVARDLGRTGYVDWVERHMFRRMQHVIVHTPEFRDRLLAAGVADARITVTPFPLHRLPAPTWTPAEVRARFGLAGKRPLLLLGLPVPRKGFQLAVRALAQLPADVVLVLVCSERQAHEREAVDHLRGIAREAGVADRLLTTGYLDDAQLASMLATVDAALAPFTAVSGSSSIAHFFAAGVPVITSDLPPMRQAHDDGAGVRLSRADDVDALAEAIRGALDAPGDFAAMRQANQRYSASHTFQHLAELVSALAGRAASERAA